VVVAVSDRGSGHTQRPVILLVEDESTIRVVATRVLEADGYRVTSAENGRAAIALIATLNVPIDLVVTDLYMPELGGEALVAELARHQRTPPVLFVSGVSHADVADLPGPMLTKPFTPVELRRRVHQVLYGSGGSASASARSPQAS
jgi:two-component system cell cycle sensor histidine kinase/response regulator CckA